MRASEYENELKQRDDTIERLTSRIGQLETEIEELKKLLTGKAEAKTAKKPTFTQNYSLDKNKRKKQRHKKSTGRRSNDAKRDLVEHQYDIFWHNVDRQQCIFHREQFAWRLINGRAVYVAYNIHDLPDSKELPLPTGLRNSRSEYGIEIILTLAYLHYWIGVSIDNAREIMRFFTGLELSKSQADSLLSQLAADWNEQYDTIAELIALSMIVYIDETGWKVGKRSSYTWAFSTPMHVLFRCGVGRGKAEAEIVLGQFFAGVGVTDDYAAYKSLFSKHQLCWAHLIRKSIKLALMHPEDKEYATFLDELCEIYHRAVRYQKDGRLRAGRATKARELEESVRLLCTRHGWTIEKNVTPECEATFIRLQNELFNNLDRLFVFVERPEVEPTNNRSERNVRGEAEIRKGGRTSKTPAGAKRRGVIMTVMASLQTRFAKFTLDVLLSEVEGWIVEGCSIFESELAALEKANAPPASEPAICPSG
jgi:transposase